MDQTLWRRHSDRTNLALLDDWLGGRRFERLLKTDLFDEALGEGLCAMLAERATHVCGVDVSPAFVGAACQRYPRLGAVCADVRTLPFADASFDVVVSNSTLDHFALRHDIHRGLAELFRVLRPAGELLITLDNLQNPIIALRSVLPFRLLRRLGVVPYYVGRTLSRRGLVRSLEERGFRVVQSRAIMHCPRVIVVPVAGLIQRRATPRSQERFLAGLRRFESLARWPTRFFSGHFVAVRAVRP